MTHVGDFDVSEIVSLSQMCGKLGMEIRFGHRLRDGSGLAFCVFCGRGDVVFEGLWRAMRGADLDLGLWEWGYWTNDVVLG